MANTFTQIHIHTVFAVQNRESLIKDRWRDELYKYIITIIQKYDHKVLSIGGMEDHIHILFGFRPTQSLSNLIQEVKRDSSEWINQKRWVLKFEWQEGYGAFSYGKSQISDVANYIENQAKHHAKYTFVEEYKKFLDKFGIKYDERYIFHEIEHDTPTPKDASLRDAEIKQHGFLPIDASLRDAEIKQHGFLPIDASLRDAVEGKQ